jgi:hypothetical protein
MYPVLCLNLLHKFQSYLSSVVNIVSITHSHYMWVTVRSYLLRLGHKMVWMQCGLATITTETDDNLRTLKQLLRASIREPFWQLTATQSVNTWTTHILF